MQLRCSTCNAIQPVSTADEADEDPRTQSIRRAFRAEHATSCVDGRVKLDLGDPDLPPVDPECWDRYLAAVRPPDDVLFNHGTGFFARPVIRDGARQLVSVCEDCWENMPRYVDFPVGLTSPESDGAGGAVPKQRPTTAETDSPNRAQAVERLRRAVCLPCYLAAFARVYPAAKLPHFDDAVIGDIGDVSPVEDTAPPPEATGRVTISRPGRPLEVSV